MIEARRFDQRRSCSRLQPAIDNPMTVQHFQAPDAPGFKLDPRVVAAFGRFAGGFWQGATRWRAWALTLGLAACLLLSTGATVALNQWNRWFFDSLEARDVASLTQAVFVFAAHHRGHGGDRRRHRAHARDPAGRLARLDRQAPGRSLAVAPALLPSQRQRQGAAQPRVPHLRRHALGHRAAGRPRHRPAAGGGWGCGLHLDPVERRWLLHAGPGLRRHVHDPRLHGDRGAGLRLPRLRADAVGWLGRSSVTSAARTRRRATSASP